MRRLAGFIDLAWKNANRNVFRSWAVSICAALMAGFAVSGTIVIGGAQDSLRVAMERLGADIIVVPAGTEHAMENAYLMGVPVVAWMPREAMDRVATIPGVRAVSPQLFLSTLRGASCCSVPEMFLVAYEPETDFTVKPWLEKNLVGSLGLGEAVGGAFVYVPADPGYILVYGYHVDLKSNLEPTGTGLDQSMFFTFETAREIARLSPTQAERELEIPGDEVSAVMVSVEPGVEPHRVAQQIQQALPQATAVESSNLFRSQRVQIAGLLQSVLALMGVAWVLSVALVGMVFSISVHERRQQIGALRALGFTRRFVLQSLLAEGLILALSGGGAGIVLSISAVYLFHQLLIQLIGVPFLIPSLLSLLVLTVGALTLAVVSVTLGALIPSLRISLMEPAQAMRK
jgi:putative ABC transport system permease protein